jgi:hypothetical protein
VERGKDKAKEAEGKDRGKVMRKLTPSDFMARVQQGYDFWQFETKHSAKEWVKYIEDEGTAPVRARAQIALAKKIIPNGVVRDFDKLKEIARLYIPYDVLVNACSDTVTDEQRDALYDHFASHPDSKSINQAEAKEIFDAIRSQAKEHIEPKQADDYKVRSLFPTESPLQKLKTIQLQIGEIIKSLEDESDLVDG